MQFDRVHPPKIFARTPTGRMVQVAGRPGEIGRLDNIVVPPEQEIRRLRPVIHFIGKLEPEPFNYGTSASYRKRIEQRQPPITASQYNRVDNLPLFQKQ